MSERLRDALLVWEQAKVIDDELGWYTAAHKMAEAITEELKEPQRQREEHLQKLALRHNIRQKVQRGLEEKPDWSRLK